MEAAMECAINNKPLFDEDVPPIAQSHANISIAVDVTGPFTNPFAAAAAAEVDAAPAIDVKETDAKVSSISFTTRIKFSMKLHLCKKRGAPGAPLLRLARLLSVHNYCSKIEPIFTIECVCVCWYQNTQIPINSNEYASMRIGISTGTGIFWIHSQNCTKLQGTNSCKLPVLVMRLKEEVQY